MLSDYDMGAIEMLASQLADIRFEYSDANDTRHIFTPLTAWRSNDESLFSSTSDVENLKISTDFQQENAFARSCATPVSMRTSGYGSTGARSRCVTATEETFGYLLHRYERDENQNQLLVDENMDPFFADMRQALKGPHPGPGYVCRICRGDDHFVTHCPMTPPKEVLKTPYQGVNQCFGMFECACGRKWESNNSFAEASQNCRHCKTPVFPYKQYPLDKIPSEKTAGGLVKTAISKAVRWMKKPNLRALTKRDQ